MISQKLITMEKYTCSRLVSICLIARVNECNFLMFSSRHIPVCV